MSKKTQNEATEKSTKKLTLDRVLVRDLKVSSQVRTGLRPPGATNCCHEEYEAH